MGHFTKCMNNPFCLEKGAKYPNIVEINYIYLYNTKYASVRTSITDAKFHKKCHFVKLSPPKRFEIIEKFQSDIFNNGMLDVIDTFKKFGVS